jgi:hypothetical protein
MIMRALLFSLALLLAGCGLRADWWRAPPRDGGADLGRLAPVDGHSALEAGTWQDGAPDGNSAMDTENSPDLAADIGAASDLLADAGASADLVDAETASGSTDAALDVSGADGPADGGCTLTGNISVDKLPAISFSGYHSQQQVADYLQGMASALPSIAQYGVLGQSAQGRNLPYLVINATCQTSPPAIFTNGTHHGDEPSSTEAVLAIPDYLLRKSTTDASVRSLLGAYAFYVLPLVNPDGRALNTRENADGLDINRDYSYPGRGDAGSFQTAEARLVKALQENVGFRAAIAYHSGAQEVVWPWCYTGDATADAGFFTAAGQRAARAMNFAIYQQSYDDYPTEGEYIDYAYMRSETLAATFEVSTAKTPSAALLAGVVNTACLGTVAWVQAVSDYDKGSLHALPATGAERARFPFAAPFDGTNRLE